MSQKVAVVLAGCGYLDGAEIRESILSLLALDKAGAEVEIFAPDIEQHHVVDHTSNKEFPDTRNVLVEAGRIARGHVKALAELKSADFDALIIPGGFGMAKNLSTLAFKGAEADLNPSFSKVIHSFFEAKKPIGALCISPAVICLALGTKGIEVTIGEDEEMAQVITSLGAKHIKCSVEDIHVDELNRIVSTPAYMFSDASIAAVSIGIEKCVLKVLEIIK